MMLSIRESSRVQGQGYWISPNNGIYALGDSSSHLEWIKSHQDIARSFNNTAQPDNTDNIQPNDADIFEKVFKQGWVRVRIEFDEADMSNLIASVSALDIELLATLPEDMKNLISSCSQLDFMDMHTGSIVTYDKNTMLQKLHRQRYAHFISIQMVK